VHAGAALELLLVYRASAPATGPCRRTRAGVGAVVQRERIAREGVS
jgi:hypothetical protein